MLTAKPMTDEHDGTLLSMRPDLPQRVADATEKVAACTINDEMPDISAYLASLAMADAIKEGELEVARVEAEFRAQMKAEREKWEAEQLECQLANEEQAKQFSDERAEYERRAAKEREQLATARAEIDKRRAEIQQARAELDAARAEFKEKKSALEARAKQVDKQVSDLEKQKRALERRAAELELRNKELQEIAALAASGAAADIAHRPTLELPPVPDDELDTTAQDDVAVIEEAVDAEEEVKAWTPIETEEPWSVPLDSDEPVREIQYQAAAVPEPEPRKRPAWMVPAGIAAAVLVLGGGAFALSRSDDGAPAPVQRVASRPATTTGTTTPAATPVLTIDSAAGTVAAVSDSAAFTAIRDSIVAADEARRIRRERAAAAAAAEADAERAAVKARTVTDSTGTVWLLDKPPGFGTNQRVTLPDSMVKPKPDTAIKPPRPDTSTLTAPLPALAKPKPDTAKAKPDSVKPTCCSR
jgi:hypothetical protein